MDWWVSDPERKKFLESALEKCNKVCRKSEVHALRKYLDEIYNASSEVTFFSDFPVFDLGMTDAILAEYDLLPMYLRDDNSPPSSVVNYVNYLRGFARCDLSIGSSKTFRTAGIERPVRVSNHDPLEDVFTIMKEVQLVKKKVTQA